MTPQWLTTPRSQRLWRFAKSIARSQIPDLVYFTFSRGSAKTPVYEWRSRRACAGGGGGQASAQRVPTILIRVKARRLDTALDDHGHIRAVEPLGAHIAVAVDRAKQRAIDALGQLDPGL
jgi:hypothetical protein